MKPIIRFFIICTFFLLSKADASSFHQVLVGYEQTTVDYLTDTYGVHVLADYEHISVLSVYVSQSVVSAMLDDPLISFVSFNQATKPIEPPRTLSSAPSLLPTSLYQPNKDMYEVMNIPKAHQRGLTGKNVSVCIVDSGIDRTHPSLKNKVVASSSFIKDSDGQYRTNDPDGHGTHVAGIITGLHPSPVTNGKTHQANGVAPNVSLYSAKVFNDKGDGNTVSLYAGINWCVGLNVDIINMSLGYTRTGTNDPDAYVFEQASEKGIVNIAASGNENTENTRRLDYVTSPARLPYVIAVGSVGVKRKGTALTTPISPFSNIGPSLAIVAPGENLFSAYRQKQHAYLSGTSMATPMVSGLAALYLEETPQATAEDIRLRLEQSAKDLGSVGKDVTYGYGLASYCQKIDQWALHQPFFTYHRSEQKQTTTVKWNPDAGCGAASYQIYLNGIPVKRTSETQYHFASLPSTTYHIDMAVIDENGALSKKSNRYTFKTQPLHYKDVSRNHWAYQAIQYVGMKKWQVGFSDGTFHPSKGVTRAEAAITFSRMLPSKQTLSKKTFKDVPQSHYAHQAIAKMVQAKVMVGTSATTFSPQQVMTREEMAVILMRLVKEKAVTKGTTGFTDVKNPKRYSYASILTMKKKGYVAGCTTTKFCPNKTITRAELAALLSRMGPLIQQKNP